MTYSISRSKWNQQYILKGVQFPEQIDPNHKFYLHRTHIITIHYSFRGKLKQKTIAFGLKNSPTLIATGQCSSTKKKTRSDIFHPYFWQKNLLNTKSSIKQAWICVLEALF